MHPPGTRAQGVNRAFSITRTSFNRNRVDFPPARHYGGRKKTQFVTKKDFSIAVS